MKPKRSFEYLENFSDGFITKIMFQSMSIRLPSAPVSTIVISTVKEWFVWIFWKTTGHRRWPSLRCCFPFVPYWRTAIQVRVQFTFKLYQIRCHRMSWPNQYQEISKNFDNIFKNPVKVVKKREDSKRFWNTVKYFIGILKFI